MLVCVFGVATGCAVALCVSRCVLVAVWVMGVCGVVFCGAAGCVVLRVCLVVGVFGGGLVFGGVVLLGLLSLCCSCAQPSGETLSVI